MYTTDQELLPADVTNGHFDVVSGKIVVSDPCYARGGMGMAEVKVTNGPWLTEADITVIPGWGDRVYQLTAWIGARPSDSEFKKDDRELYVDSGQMGFACDATYPVGNTGEHDDDSFYGRACNATDSNDQAGSVPGGFYSRSGLGDGSYDLYVRTNERGDATALRVVFLRYEETDPFGNEYE